MEINHYIYKNGSPEQKLYLILGEVEKYNIEHRDFEVFEKTLKCAMENNYMFGIYLWAGVKRETINWWTYDNIRSMSLENIIAKKLPERDFVIDNVMFIKLRIWSNVNISGFVPAGNMAQELVCMCEEGKKLWIRYSAETKPWFPRQIGFDSLTDSHIVTYYFAMYKLLHGGNLSINKIKSIFSEIPNTELRDKLKKDPRMAAYRSLWS
jgi:hypothetical protein